MVWPSPQDYSEAVQMPLSSFQDRELKNATAQTNSLGLPTCMSGNFASVFCLRSEKRKFAARCFLHDVPDQEHRYSEISRFILNDDLPYTVSFEYLSAGIKVRDDWFPLLKMHWVEGITLNQYVAKNVENCQALNLLAGYFKQMLLELHRAGIAHGDLQHDNILVSDDELRLVDYDGMFVPALAGNTANELGHRNYQHPRRDKSTFGPFLDNFSAWIIYASLKILAIDPSLWRTLNGGDDCLLFRHSDFVSDGTTRAFDILGRHRDEQVRRLTRAIKLFLELPIESIPGIETPVDELNLKENVAPEPEEAPQGESAPVAVIDSDGGLVTNELEVAKREAQMTLPMTAVSIGPAVLSSGKDRVEQRIASQLSTDEHVKLAGSPWTSEVLKLWAIVGMVCPLLFTVSLAIVGHSTSAMSFTLLILVLIGVIVTSRRTRYYFLTDRRIIIVSSGFQHANPDVYSIPISYIGSIEVKFQGLLLELIGRFEVAPKQVSNVVYIRLSEEQKTQFLNMLPNTIPQKIGF